MLERTSWRRWLPKEIEAGREGTGGDSAAIGESADTSGVGRGASGDCSRDLGVLEAPVPREVGWRHPKG